MKGLLSSAVSNAKQMGVDVESLFVENATVNKGLVLKRTMPRARGSASRINRRTSHIMLTLVEKPVDGKKVKTVKKEEKIEVKTEKVEKKSKKVKEPKA